MKIYLSHPYRDDPVRRLKQVMRIARKLVREDSRRILLIPHLFFYDFERRFGRKYAMKCSKALLGCADIMCIGIPKSATMSAGMQEELKYAVSNDIKVVYLSDLADYEIGFYRRRKPRIRS